VILHVDMDAFFASVEQRDHPEWRGRPVIVGAGPHERGVVSTCSYEARRFGVHSAMPSRTAYTLCPHAIFVRPDMGRYHAVSQLAFEVFSHYSPFVEGVSVDEAFLDVTGTLHLYGACEGDGSSRFAAMRRLGEALRREVYETCGVTCSVGIAPNRLLAKLGSEEHKPDGLTIQPFESNAIVRYLASKPVSALWGVGQKTAALLRPYGIVTCADVQRQPDLRGLLGDATAVQLADAAFGRSDDNVAWEEVEEKSVSREHTFDCDVSDRAVVRAKLLELVEEVGVRFRREMRWAKTARIKLRDDGFSTLTRQLPFARPARDDVAFRAAALALFDRERITRVRLVGFGVTGFVATPHGDETPQLFEDESDVEREKRERLSDTLDGLRARGLL